MTSAAMDIRARKFQTIDQITRAPIFDDSELWFFKAFGVRLDAISRDGDDALELTDFKSPDGAGFTSNQTKDYPLLQQFGGEVVGAKGGNLYPAGTIIPPTPVTIVRPIDLLGSE